MVRFKNRYLLFQLVWKDGKVDGSITEAVLLAVFRDSLQQNFGDYGLGTALASLQVKVYDAVSGLCIVRCSRDEHRQVWCALSLITEIRHRAVALRLLQLTGAVAACQRAAAGAMSRGGARSTAHAQLAAAAAARLHDMAV